MKEIEQIQSQIKELESKADKLKKLTELYPDLQKHQNRWKTVRYYSKSVNDKVDKVEIRHNCGCCSDSPVEVWPYLETEFGPVYSDPPSFNPGERDSYSYCDRSYPGWEDRLIAANISKTVIQRVQTHFEYEDSKHDDFHEDTSEEVSDD